MDTDEEFCSYEEAGISEQDLIEHVDILFRTSDVDGTGYVPVSHIIEYLRIHTSFGEVYLEFKVDNVPKDKYSHKTYSDRDWQIPLLVM